MEEFVVQYLHTKIVFKIGQGQNYPKMVLYLGEWLMACESFYIRRNFITNHPCDH